MASTSITAPQGVEHGPHCETCVCGCTCGYGGQHEPSNTRCELNQNDHDSHPPSPAVGEDAPHPDELDSVVRVLAEHTLRQVDPACSCGWNWDHREVILPSAVDFDPARYQLADTVRPRQHRDHLAAALLAHRSQRPDQP